MNKQLIKTRFAPSPTGFMHVGNFRTCLFSYLCSRKNNGKFILRLEDTDQNREVKDAEQAIFRVLKWAGLEHDEGPDIGGPNGPYRQSERLLVYQKYIKQLLDNNHAYYCFCAPDRLKKIKQQQIEYGRAANYDRCCLKLSSAEIKQKLNKKQPYTIRQKVNTNGQTTFADLVMGKITIDNNILDDPILIKSDGWPTYNFANVIDDHLMEITHIIRGQEYINSTPKYIQLYQNFGWPIPAHAHLPLILDQDKSKLSKRQGDASVEDLKTKGYLPETIINFVALLGWNPNNDQELFSLEQLIHEFDLTKVNKSNAVFDITKLNWMNSHYIKQLSLDKLTQLCTPYLEKTYKLQATSSKLNYIKSIIGLEQERIKTLSEIGDRVNYFFEEPKYDPKLLIWKKSNKTETKSRLQFLIEYSATIPTDNWTRNALEESLLEQIKINKLDNGATLWPMRVALSGHEKSPSPFEIAEVLGKKITIERLKTAMQSLK